MVSFSAHAAEMVEGTMLVRPQAGPLRTEMSDPQTFFAKWDLDASTFTG